MNFRLFLPLTILFLFATTACNECIGPFGKEKVVCNNGGTCNDGQCDCLKGYFGDRCEILDLCELNDVVCVQGNCEDGVCYCGVGYEGSDCSVESRLKFLGTYSFIERCPGLDTINGYNIEITRDPLDQGRIDITNVFNFSHFPINGFFSAVSAVANKNAQSFTIPTQQPDDNGKVISGSGLINDTDTNNIRLEIDFTIINGGKEYSCSMEAVRL